MSDAARSDDLFSPDVPAAPPEGRERAARSTSQTVAIAAEIDVDAELAPTARLIASPALGAFLAMRCRQATRHGHTPEADAARGPAEILAPALQRLKDCRELLAGDPPPERLATALRKIEAGGAVLLALQDRISSALRPSRAQSRDAAGEGEGGAA